VFWQKFISLSMSHTHTTIVEEFFFAAIMEYQTNYFTNKNICYLFDSLESLYDPIKAQEVGYTHLIGPSKLNKNILA